MAADTLVMDCRIFATRRAIKVESNYNWM